MSDKSLIVFGDESKLVKGKIGYYDENGWPVVIADVNQYKDVVSDPLKVAYKMAAAPDMLEALENLMYYLETDDMKYLDLNKARAAIAKARGESE